MKHARWRAALILSLGVVAGAVAPPTGAQTPLPLGPQALANSVTAGDQDQTAAAMDANGDYVVVWRDELLDGSGSAIVGRRFSSTTGLPLSAQFVINTTVAGNQANPAIAMNGNGRFVVVWEGPDSTVPATTGIFASLRAPNGSAIVGEFPVNTTVAGTQRRPAVAMQADGRFLITWQDDSGTGFGITGNDIVGRSYPASFPGDPPGSPTRLNTSVLSGDQEEPAVVANPATGGWFVAWQGPTLPPVAAAVWLRVLDGAGGGQPEAPLNLTFDASLRSHAALATNSLGDAVAVWQDALANSIFARRIAAGIPTGPEEQVNVSPDHLNREPAVALDQFGNFVTVWVEAVGALWEGDAPEGSPIVIQGRKKNGAGGLSAPLLPPPDALFPINSDGADFADPVIVGRPHGSFVAVWQGTDPDDSSGFGISLRRFLDALFGDDFETANTTRWSTTVP